MLRIIDFSPGVVTYDDFVIDPKASFKSQEFSFKEDMFQVCYEDGKYAIDIGWYPEHDENGSFLILLIKDTDWTNPVYSKRTKNIKKLYEYAKECSEIVRNLIKDEKKVILQN